MFIRSGRAVPPLRNMSAPPTMLHSFRMHPPGGPIQFQLDLGDPAQNAAHPLEIAAPAETPEAIFRRVFRTLRPRTPMPEVEIQWRRYASANSSVRLEQGKLSLKIAD